MYGQTNCFVLPEGRYGAYAVASGEVLVMSERAAKGLAHQVSPSVSPSVRPSLCVCGTS